MQNAKKPHGFPKISLFVAVALGGCGAAHAPVPLPPDHPASAAAAEAPLPTPSAALDVATPQRPPKEEAATPHSHGHGGHR